MNNRQRLLDSDPRQQSALRELAKINQHLRICRKRLSRIKRLQPLTAEQVQALLVPLEQASNATYQLGCLVLGVESKK